LGGRGGGGVAVYDLKQILAKAIKGNWGYPRIFLEIMKKEKSEK